MLGTFPLWSSCRPKKTHTAIRPITCCLVSYIYDSPCCMFFDILNFDKAAGPRPVICLAILRPGPRFMRSYHPEVVGCTGTAPTFRVGPSPIGWSRRLYRTDSVRALCVHRSLFIACISDFTPSRLRLTKKKNSCSSAQVTGAPGSCHLDWVLVSPGDRSPGLLSLWLGLARPSPRARPTFVLIVFRWAGMSKSVECHGGV